MKYAVIVYCPKQRRKSVKWPLKKYGLRWAGNNTFKGSVNKWEYKNIADFCHKRHLRYKINNNYGNRSVDYRKKFFRHNPPFIRNRYFCAYCGKLVPRRKITIDHLYPIGCASKSINLQKKLKKMGIRNINDTRNLVAACKRCNSKKGKKMGVWIVKGKLGRNPEIWVMRHTTRLIILTVVIYMILSQEYQTIAKEVISFFNMHLWDLYKGGGFLW